MLVASAFLYTKVIKPGNFSYTSKNIWIRYKIKQLFKTLIEQKKLVNGYKDAMLNVVDYPLVVLDYLYFGYDHIYVVASNLYWNIDRVEFTGNHYQVVTKRQKTLDLPLDVQIFLKSVKNFKKVFNLSSEVIIIVPSLNKKYVTCNINNINFMYYENISTFINSHESSSVSQITAIQQRITSQLRMKKRRTILPKSWD